MSRTRKDRPYRFGGTNRSRMPPAPRWFRRHVWTTKLRLEARTVALRAIQEYRASGCTNADELVEYYQHRHNAGYLYW